jgi:hypothetical protein
VLTKTPSTTPTTPSVGLLFNVLAMLAEFQADLARMQSRKGMKIPPLPRVGSAASSPS